MCLEDIRIGRRSPSAVRSVNVDTTAVPVASPDPNRISIRFTAPPTNRVTLTTDPNTVIDVGLTLYPAGNELALNIKDDGDCVTRAWYAVTTGAANRIGVLETYLPER